MAHAAAAGSTGPMSTAFLTEVRETLLPDRAAGTARCHPCWSA